MLSDSGEAGYGFDGNNTYIVRKYRISGTNGLRTWRVRTNISSAGSPSIAKKTNASTGMMQVFGFNNGQYRVTLTPSHGNNATFQLFDLLGRNIMTKTLENFTTPVTFTIPEREAPNTPFLAKTVQGEKSETQKVIPVGK